MSRFITEEYEIFKFSELSAGAKEKVKQWYLEGQEEYIFTEGVHEVLFSEYGITTLKTNYSLGYCQGDGLCLSGYISFDDLKSEKFKKIAFKNFTISDYKAFSELENYTSQIYFKHNSRYYYASSVNIDIDYYCNSEKMEKLIDKMINKLLTNIKNWYFSECLKFEKEGYSYFYEISNDDLQENCEANDYEFYASGEIFAEY